MGGSGKGYRSRALSSSSWSECFEQNFEQVKCQICDSTTHTAIKCPCVYTKCRQCEKGHRRLWISSTSAHPGEVFLKCQFPKCTEFQWFKEAIKYQRISRSPVQYTAPGCYKCGSDSHWKKDCPATKGKKVMATNSEEDSYKTPTKLVIEISLGESVQHLGNLRH